MHEIRVRFPGGANLFNLLLFRSSTSCRSSSTCHKTDVSRVKSTIRGHILFRPFGPHWCSLDCESSARVPTHSSCRRTFGEQARSRHMPSVARMTQGSRTPGHQRVCSPLFGVESMSFQVRSLPGARHTPGCGVSVVSLVVLSRWEYVLQPTYVCSLASRESKVSARCCVASVALLSWPGRAPGPAGGDTAVRSLLALG